MTGWRITLPLAVGLASPDMAGAAEHGAGMVVSYADLDLLQQADARRLRARVQGAIRSLCAQPHKGALASPAESICRRTAMVRADDQIKRAVALATRRQSVAQIRSATAEAR